MDLDFSDAQNGFRQQVRDFIAREADPAVTRRLRQGYPARKDEIVRWQKALCPMGWSAPHWPKAYGGADLGIAERLILLEEMALACCPMPQGFNINLVGPVLMKFGTEAQKTFFLPQLASFDLWFCQGFSEPNAGSDLSSLQTRAEVDGSDLVINGEKIWTTGAHWADWMFALVRTDRGASAWNGISFVLIDMRLPGVEVRPIHSIDHDHHLNQVVLQDVRIPLSCVVGEMGKGWDYAKYLLSNERTGIANVGYCKERSQALQQTLERLKPGLDAATQATLSQRLFDLHSEIRCLEVLNFKYLLGQTAQARTPHFASVLKLKVTAIQQEISELFVALNGQDGVVSPLGISAEPADADVAAAIPLAARYFYIRAAGIYGGTTEVQKNIIAKSLLR